MKKLLFVVCALFGFMACTQNPIEEQSAIRTDAPETIRVGFEDDETRIQLNSAQKTVWTKGDLVSVFYRSNANQQWKYDGETGERVASLYRVDAGSASRDMDYVVLAYPYSADYVISATTGNIEAKLPATQYYANGSYGVGSNLMVSQSEFTQFSLKSVCGWLKLQLTGNGEVVKSIKFRGNNGEQVAGLIYVDTETAEATLASEMGGSDDNNAGGNLVFDDTILTEVTLDCGEGVTLGAEATAFYISLPPQTFANGFTVVVECDDHKPMTLSTSNALTIERNTIQPMASVECDATPNIPYNEIWYTATQLVEPYYDVAFGATLISNNFDPETGKGILTFDGDVTYVGDSAFYECFDLTSVIIPDSVTSIGAEAFASCSSLTSVTIPEGVTTIGNYAFCECTSLTSITIPDSVTTIGYGAFEGCSNLTSVTIGDSVTTIGEYAFCFCHSLTNVTIPDSVTTIGGYAYLRCSSLTSVTIGDSVTTIGEGAFSECRSLTSVTIPDSVTTIKTSAFGFCDSLTSVTIPDSVTTIGERAFAGCSSLQEFNGKFASKDGRCLIIDGTLNSFAPAGLTEYTIPDGVTTIGYAAFAYYSSLTSVTIPDSVTTIGNHAFEGCSSLISVTIPDSVTTIGYAAFLYCSSLTSVTIPDSVTTIGDYAFAYCDSLTSITIPDSVTTIGDSAFACCDKLREFNGKYASEDGRCLIIDGTLNSFAPAGLTEYTILDSVTSIGGYAFYDCSSLTSVTIPDSVTTIGWNAFCYCSSLTSVTIPDSVTTIGDWAFEDCTSLTSVYCKATTPPALGGGAFYNNPSDPKIYVPMESVAAYKSAPHWSDYADDIVGYNF